MPGGDLLEVDFSVIIFFAPSLDTACVAVDNPNMAVVWEAVVVEAVCVFAGATTRLVKGSGWMSTLRWCA